jgi:polyisoprenoid-binding protein YceI
VRPEDSSVHVAIDTASVSTPIKYNNPPTKEGFLDVLKFPQATFVSTSIRRTGPTHGQISGNLTLRGVTQPVVIDAEMVGVNKVVGGFTGLGFSGVMKIKRSAFGSTYLAQAVGDDIELVLDIEFLKV